MSIQSISSAPSSAPAKGNDKLAASLLEAAKDENNQAEVLSGGDAYKSARYNSSITGYHPPKPNLAQSDAMYRQANATFRKAVDASATSDEANRIANALKDELKYDPGSASASALAAYTNTLVAASNRAAQLPSAPKPPHKSFWQRLLSIF